MLTVKFSNRQLNKLFDALAPRIKFKRVSGENESCDFALNAVQGDAFSVTKAGREAKIVYSKLPEFCHGLAILAADGTKKSFTLSKKVSFTDLGIMLDNSRNAVLKPEAVKKYIEILALLGYTNLMLYTEDTYEVEGEPYFGYLRGRFTSAEIKEMDAYAAQFGIELIPCIQTLAHLNAIFRWEPYHQVKDCDDILLVDELRTYSLLDSIFISLKNNFTSRRINIGYDEAHMVGLGKYLTKHGYKDRFDILLRHLYRVMLLCEEHGFKPMMWSDMFFRLATGGEYYKSDLKLNPEIVKQVPGDMSLIYWDYYSLDKNKYMSMLESHKQFGNSIVFAGGAWKWHGFTPDNRYSLGASKAALDACISKGIKNVFVTAWGDNGAECSSFGILPTVAYYSERCYGESEALAERIFRAVTGVRKEVFMEIEVTNHITGDRYPEDLNCTGKIFLYNDILLGAMDSLVRDDYRPHYERCVKRLNAARKSAGEWKYLFETQIRLCQLLAGKFDMGLRVKKAYDDGDSDALLRLSKEITALTKYLMAFYAQFKAQWETENKPHGFDVQDIRLGGALMRMNSAARKLQLYATGKTPSVPELEEKRLNAYSKVNPEKCLNNNYTLAGTVNIL